MATFPTDIISRIKKSKSQKNRYELEWSAAMRMLTGDQWTYYNRNSNRFVDVPTDKFEKTRVTVNHMLNIERNIISRLTLDTPQPIVIPASDASEDILKATASEMALRYFWFSDKQERKWQECVRWMAQCGNVAIHTYYKPGVTVKKQLDSTDGDAYGDTGTETSNKSFGSDKTMGKVTTDVISPFNLFFEPGAPSPKESRWTAIRTFVTKAELADAYPEKSKEIERLSYSSGQTDYRYQDYKPKDRLELYEIYWRDGRHAIVCEGLYLEKEVSEQVRSCYPVRTIRYHVIEGELWGQGPMVQIAELQQLYNRTRTQIHMNVLLMGNPPWFVPRTADVRKGAIMNRPGAVIRYTPGGGAPFCANPQQLPAHVLREPAVLREEMSDVAGAHGITLGRREPGVKSGVHARTLTQQYSAQLLATQHEIIAAVEDVMLSALMLMKRYYNETRLIRMLDITGKPAWKQLSNSDLVNNPEVFIDGNTLFKADASARETRVMELVQLGLMPPEEAREALSFRTYNSFVTDKFLAMSHARDMLELVLMDREIEILPTDDFQAFEKVFSEYSKTVEFYEQPEYIRDYVVDVVAAMAQGVPYDREDAKRQKDIRQLAPQLQAVAEPAPPVDPAEMMAETAFPAQGQNLLGMASPPTEAGGG